MDSEKEIEPYQKAYLSYGREKDLNVIKVSVLKNKG
jgi:hypothetical protein